MNVGLLYGIVINEILTLYEALQAYWGLSSNNDKSNVSASVTILL